MTTDDPDLELLSRAKAHHGPQGRFINPWRPHDHRRMLREFFRWRLTPNPAGRAKRRSRGPEGGPPDFAGLEADGRDYLVWLGHATVYGRLGRVRLVTDPLFGGIMGRFARRTPCPAEPADLPGLDLVLISHDHFDHLDLPSLARLERRFGPLVVAGAGLGPWLGRHGLARVRELDWWESSRVGGLDVFCFPVQHWSRRRLADTDRTLWCGYALAGGEGPRKLAFVGDSGYFEGFRELGDKLGPFDVAALPIGCYQPRRLMAPQHMSPAEAYQAAVDLRARVMIPTHFGTFGLGDEPLDQPPRDLRAAVEARRSEAGGGAALPEPIVLAPGGSYQW